MCQMIVAFAQPGSCILVFLPGLKEIEDFFEAITSLDMNSESLSLRLLALHSIIPRDEQNLIFIPAGKNECKIILSTNITETSITIEDVTVVVDLGFVRRMVYDKTKKVTTLSTEWCSRTARVQRMGRAGRVTDGMVLRFYTQSTLWIISCPRSMSLIYVRWGCLFLNFDWTSLISVALSNCWINFWNHQKPVLWTTSCSNLVSWGALGPAPEFNVLDFGRVVAALPVDIAIVLASRFGLAGEMSVIAAGHMLNKPLHQLPRRFACRNELHFGWPLFGCSLQTCLLPVPSPASLLGNVREVITIHPTFFRSRNGGGGYKLTLTAALVTPLHRTFCATNSASYAHHQNDVRGNFNVSRAAASSPWTNRQQDALQAHIDGGSRSAGTINNVTIPSLLLRELCVGDQVIPITKSVRNKFIEDCVANGTNTGALCSNECSHSMMTCPDAHYDQYELKQAGISASGSELLDNAGLQKLRKDTKLQGGFLPIVQMSRSVEVRLPSSHATTT
ncbi:helicase, putative [Bodo saltans]|uniref:Helicase, putative n=1 Tax=Bodo saltans TaxID=75058 RepID=A0A0S4KHL3_BODSA|nr:helicase, putative [Bodo saltans]|eukprot:CUI15180.1 helicase, putative [Bodo saltans]